MQYGGSNILFFLEVMINVTCNLKNKIGQMSRSNIMYQHKDLITRNIHVKYQSSGTHYSNCFNSKVKVFKKWARLQGQTLGFHGKVLKLEILI